MNSKRTEILNNIQKPQSRNWMKSASLAAAFSAMGGAAVYYIVSDAGSNRNQAMLETSDTGTLQGERNKGGVLIPELDEPEKVTVVPSDQDDVLREENARLLKELESERKASEDSRAAFEERLDEIEAEQALRMAEMEASYAAEQASQEASIAAEAAERQAIEEERQRRQEQLRERMQAPPVVSNSDGDVFDQGTVGEARESMSGEREFLIQNAAATETRRASVTANPSNTVVQGTVIEAALEVAINSDLQGQVSAIVSRDVWSQDMTRVLVPKGSKLFGTYSSELGQTQQRVLVAWTRLMTTDGQSVSLQAFGSDRLGRAGMVSDVKTHFFSRFGSAALVSMISVLPLLAAEDSNSNNISLGGDVMQDVGDDLSSAVGDVMKDYLGRKPTILVHQGENVSVRVDADLEFY